MFIKYIIKNKESNEDRDEDNDERLVYVPQGCLRATIPAISNKTKSKY